MANKGDGKGQAGSDPGAHILEVDVSLEELAAILGDELELPRIEPKGKANISQEKSKYNSIRRTGPESLRHFKRTYFQALRRQISSGTYDPHKPHDRADPRGQALSLLEHRAAAARPTPSSIYMMDVSGSMTDEQKEIVRTEAFWLDTWLKSQYDGVEVRYIIHDAVAQEVDEETFYHTRESGGTRISSAYKVCHRLDPPRVPPDGMEHLLLPVLRRRQLGRRQRTKPAAAARRSAAARSNLFCYGQVESPYGSGEYIRACERPLRRQTRQTGPLGNRRQRSHLRFDQSVFGKRKMTMDSGR